jgi:hypothetical protein
MTTTAFLEPTPRAVRAFQIVYAALALNFVVPAISYMVAPELALGTLDRVNRALGGGPYPFVESGRVWHMLASGNVMTLGFMCALLLVDLRRFHPALPALAFLKGFSATYAAWIGATQRVPAFLAIAALDGGSTIAMIVFANRARRAMDGDRPRSSPWWVRLVLPGSDRIERNLERVRAAGVVERVPTTAQIVRGVARMVHRLIFRSDTVGTCKTNRVRPTWRAKLLAFRIVRLPFLFAERAIAPLDLSGLASSPARIIRHLLAAHHDARQFAYDLELLALHPGAMEALHAAARAVVLHDTPRTRWLRDLVVFEGYHESLLAAVEATLRGERILSPAEARDPDISFYAYLDWCARFEPAGQPRFFAARR